MLSKRETTIAVRYADGLTYKQVAKVLDIAPRTVRNHLTSIYQKLEISNKAQLVQKLAEFLSREVAIESFQGDTPTSGLLKLLETTELPNLDRPSIAVLPFANLGQKKNEHFCQGIATSIHNNLTRFQDLFVAGRSSIFNLANVYNDATEIALNLGVKFVVRGTVRIERDRARISAELVEGVSGATIWSEQYERKLSNLLVLEADISNAIVANVSLKLEKASFERVSMLTSEQLTAYEWEIRGWHLIELGGQANLQQATRSFNESLKLEPDSASSYAGLSVSYGYQCGQLLPSDYSNALENAFQNASKAVSLNASESRAHYAMVCASSLKGYRELADQHSQSAVELNPSEYHNLCCRGYTLMSLNRTEESIEFFSDSLRRNPLAPNSCLAALGLMEYLLNNYAQATAAFSRMLPSYLQRHCSLAAGYAQLGYTLEAKMAASEFQKIAANRNGYPTSSRSNEWKNYWKKVYPHLEGESIAHVIDGMRKTGLYAIL